MREVVAARLQRFAAPGSMGVVTDTRFVRCFWPKLDRPTPIFAEGSSGIRVVGNPTPRNVVFPKDTVFEAWVPDADYPAELDVSAKFGVVRFVGLTEAQGDYYVERHAFHTQRIVKENPKATVFQTKADCFFLREKVLASAIELKPRYDEYVAELSAKEAADLVDGKAVEADLKAAKEYVHISDGRVREKQVTDVKAVR